MESLKQITYFSLDPKSNIQSNIKLQIRPTYLLSNGTVPHLYLEASSKSVHSTLNTFYSSTKSMSDITIYSLAQARNLEVTRFNIDTKFCVLILWNNLCYGFTNVFSLNRHNSVFNVHPLTWLHEMISKGWQYSDVHFTNYQITAQKDKDIWPRLIKVIKGPVAKSQWFWLQICAFSIMIIFIYVNKTAKG